MRCWLSANAVPIWVSVFCMFSTSVFTTLAARFVLFMFARPTLEMPSPAPRAKAAMPTMNEVMMTALPPPLFIRSTGTPASMVRRSRRPPCWGVMPAKGFIPAFWAGAAAGAEAMGAAGVGWPSGEGAGCRCAAPGKPAEGPGAGPRAGPGA